MVIVARAIMIADGRSLARDGVLGTRRVDARKIVAKKQQLHNSKCRNVERVSRGGDVNQVRTCRDCVV